MVQHIKRAWDSFHLTVNDALKTRQQLRLETSESSNWIYVFIGAVKICV